MSDKRNENTQEHFEASPSDNTIVEDGPTMRSVAIMSSPPAMSFQRLSLLDDKTKASSKPFLYQNTSYGVKPAIVVSGAKGTTTSPVQTTNPWNVVKALPLPPSYRMERSNVRVPSDTTPVTISQRIADYFFENSIAATYDQNQALAIASTSSCVKFHVRLWSDENDNSTFVEIQRFAGCSIEFQMNARDILRTAKFGKDAKPNIRSFSMPIPRFLPKIPDSVWEANAKEAIEIARSNLKDSHRMDSHAIAITSLEQLSQCDHCRIYCAKEILSQDSDILPILVSILQRNDLSIRSDETVCGIDECFQLMRRDAISTIANCVETAQEKSELQDGAMYCISLVLSPPPSTKQKAAVPALSSLVHDIANAELNAHDAAVSCRCVHIICKYSQHENSSIVNELLRELGTESHINTAMTSSKCRHSLLQQELVRLLQIL